MYPILLNTPQFQIFSYPLFMGLAWGFGYQLWRYLLVRENESLDGFRLMFWGSFISSWVGAKVLFLLLSTNNAFVLYASSSSFWFGGGFVFYGGVLGASIYILGIVFLLKMYPLNKLHYMFPSIAIGHAIGRIGCFLAGCCYGTTCSLPWKVHLHDHFRHPVQLYETFGLLFIAYVLWRLIRKKMRPYKVILAYMGAYSFLRFITEIYRGDLIRGAFFLGLSPSQIISILIFGIAVILLFYFGKMKKS